jgi:hypothetical protein
LTGAGGGLASQSKPSSTLVTDTVRTAAYSTSDINPAMPTLYHPTDSMRRGPRLFRLTSI